MENKKQLLKDSLEILKDDCKNHDHAPSGECLVIELENLCGKQHNNGELSTTNCAECTAIKEKI